MEDFAAQLTENLYALQRQVLGGRFQPDALLRVWLPRPGKTPRPLGIPTVRDRVLHTTLARAITPLLETEFDDCSFAYRQGRSVRMAVERITQLQRQGYRWVVEADIERFFDCLPHDRLLTELRAVVHDDNLTELIGMCLRAPVREKDKYVEVSIGVPQGSPLSPLLANLYLDHLDDALLDDNLALIRYADDFVVLTKSRQRAQEAIELTETVLKTLELKLNPLKTRIVNFETGFQFLGWSFVRSLAVPVQKMPYASLPHDKPPALDDKICPTAPETESGTRAPPEPDQQMLEGEMTTAFDEAFAQSPTWQPRQSAEEATPPDTADVATVWPAGAPDHTNDAVMDEAPPLPPPSLQRTLYLVDTSVSLATENRHLIVRRETEVLLDLPAVNVDQVMLFGRNSITTAALICCAQHGIPIAYLSRLGKFYGRFEPAAQSSATLLAAQFSANTDADLSLRLSREFIRGKLANSALLISRYLRHRQGETASAIHEIIDTLRDLMRRTRSAASLESLRGLEGAGAAAYFAAWRLWLSRSWQFGARQQQRGADPINALLDFGYTLLYQSSAGLLQARGLNPWIGHLHRAGSGHMALASDIMEEFRAMVVDTAVLNLCLNDHLTPDDFVKQQGACVLRTGPAKRFVREIELRLNSERQHPRTGERLDLRRIMDGQIRALTACYRQRDAKRYEACIFR
ncbi:MAG TPA: CRISPR-associated endonuclease Cas1 [Accumulibacter sp.]|nr:CRISPR-associated endonuclease Cas1 [Accumulibacter sp.]HND79870.1 CRISPR-associated endonuclease Cas1 [Accumulibacter sp.]HNL76777.1 CRISPR-associated endonuclease Cas1 [Accumulibacter sp.]HNM75710.1 CRISPR-associated endonuclease Cas1 [Accumulibacter sp.]